MKVGYIRVSSVDQNLDRQLDGVELDKVFEEKISGKTREREELNRCIEFLREGDTLFVHSADRLARNLRDLLNIIDELVEQGVTVKLISENIEFGNKENPYGYLMLSVLGACAQFEVNMIKIRQREGIKKAKERGQHFGRKPLKPKMVKQLQNLRDSGMPVIEIVNYFKAKGVKISTSTIYKYTKG